MATNSPVLDEILSGDALTLSAVARLIPAHRGAGRANPSTVWRWVVQGTRTADGRVVKLEAARVGNRWLTSRKAVTRYMLTLTPTSGEDSGPQLPLPEHKHRKAVEAANRRLAEMGA